MSAECSKCGSDIVYPAGTWPIGECPTCVAATEVNRLRAELARVTAERDEAVATLNLDSHYMTISQAEAAQTHREIATEVGRLRAALERYGAHARGCNRRKRIYGPNDTTRCNCGLVAALRLSSEGEQTTAGVGGDPTRAHSTSGSPSLGEETQP